MGDKKLTEQQKKDREDVAKLLYKTLSVKYPDIKIEKCYEVYDSIISEKKD